MPIAGAQDASALTFEQFRGINTQTTRAGVDDSQMFWCDGFMPLAPRNLRTLPGVGAQLYAPGGGLTIACFEFANIGATPYCIVFLSNGSVVAVNTSNGATTTILAAGGISSPFVLNVGVSQWSGQYVIIVANQANGYWLWDGSNVYTAGTVSPNVVMTNVGAGYTATPTVTMIGGSGSGSSLVAVRAGGIITGVSVVAPGSGYLATDFVQVLFTGGNPTPGSGGSVTATLSGGTSGIVTSLAIVASGSGYSNPSLTFTGQGSPQAAGYAFVTSGSITSVSLTSAGLYKSPVTVTVADTVFVATATANLMPFGVQGTAVEVYGGHVWVARGPTVYFSAPGDFGNFATSAGGGNFTTGDAFLKSRYVRLLSCNGFLWLIGDSSANYISGVQTSGTPPTTTFTNQNADPQVGTAWPASAMAFGRSVVYANDLGMYALSGGAASKISGPMDGVWNSVPGFGGVLASTACANIYNRKVLMALLRIVDPISGVTANKLLMTDGEAWWSAAQEIGLTFIRSQEIDSAITAYGTDGAAIRPLFQLPSTAITKYAASRLWDQPGGYERDKAVQNLWATWHCYSSLAPNVIVSVDGQNGSVASQATYTLAGPAGTGLHVSAPQAVGQKGEFLGLTVSTSAADAALVSVKIGPPQDVGFRGR